MSDKGHDVIGLLSNLSNAFGPPGNEDRIREILRANLEKHADDVEVDKLGNIIFSHHGREEYPTVMLAAHMDEVAFLTTFIESNGFLRFQAIGGVASSVVPGQRVLLEGTKGFLRGLIGTKPPHIMSEDEQKKVVPIEDLFIDIGAENVDEVKQKGIEIGSTGVFDVEFAELGEGYVMGKAFDDRAGCAVLVEVFRALDRSPYNIAAVGTVQEEVGLRGAHTATWQVEPDFALALEGTFAADVPGSRPDKVSSSIKGGPVVTIMDRSVISHPTVLKTLIRVAGENKIPFQFKKVIAGGTDAGAIHLSRAGVPSGTVAVPCRYIHGPASIAHEDDIENTILLATEFVKAISASMLVNNNS